MPMAFLFVGIVLLVTAIRGTSLALGSLIVNDLVGDNTSGKPGFLLWCVCILVVGSLGYVPSMKKFSDTFIVLVMLSLVLANAGFASQFFSAFENVTSAPNTLGVDAAQLGSQAQSSAGGPGLSSAISGVQSAIGIADLFAG